VRRKQRIRPSAAAHAAVSTGGMQAAEWRIRLTRTFTCRAALPAVPVQAAFNRGQ
jgi:hypothetical protein